MRNLLLNYFSVPVISTDLVAEKDVKSSERFFRLWNERFSVISHKNDKDSNFAASFLQEIFDQFSKKLINDMLHKVLSKD